MVPLPSWSLGDEWVTGPSPSSTFTASLMCFSTSSNELNAINFILILWVVGFKGMCDVIGSYCQDSIGSILTWHLLVGHWGGLFFH